MQHVRQDSPDKAAWYRIMNQRMEEEDYGEGFIAESHPLRPTHLSVPMGGMGGNRDSRAPSISSSVTDMDVPIYTRETTIPLSAKRHKMDIDKREGNQDQPSTPTALAPADKLPRADKDAGFNPHLAFAIGAAALGSSFQHGYNTGVVNPPGKLITGWIKEIKRNRSEIPLDDEDLTADATMTWATAVSIFCVGGMLGGALVGTAADRFGRKGSLLLNNIFVFAAVIAESLAKPMASYELIILGRFIIGINAGLNAGLAPMYLAEISPMHLRGAVGTVYQLIITISILIAQVLGMNKLMGTPDLWPWLLALTMIPAIVQLVTLPFCPESPKYLLLSKGRDMDAQRALTWLRGTIEVHDEMEEMRAEYESMKLVPRVTLTELIMNSSLRIPLFIAVMIMLAQQLSGINAIMFYSTDIFSMASLDEVQAQNATIAVGVVNVFMTFVSMILVEKAGRKTLLLIGFFGMFIDTGLLAVLLVNKGSTVVSIMSVLMVVMFIVLFASGPGSIPWFLVSELFNQSARPTATSVAIAINWGANFLVGITFPLLSEAIGSNVFFIFAIIQCFFTWFIWYKVPETKNKSIEEISSMFRQQSYQ